MLDLTSVFLKQVHANTKSNCPGMKAFTSLFYSIIVVYFSICASHHAGFLLQFRFEMITGSHAATHRKHVPLRILNNLFVNSSVSIRTQQVLTWPLTACAPLKTYNTVKYRFGLVSRRSFVNFFDE